jgi:hypothetical protein
MAELAATMGDDDDDPLDFIPDPDLRLNRELMLTPCRVGSTPTLQPGYRRSYPF